jgi:2-haloacid dehalogenase
MTLELKHKKALTFDCYGTLIDWENGVIAALHTLGHTDMDNEHILSLFADHETLIQQEHPTWLYPQVLSEVYHRLMNHLSLDVDNEKAIAFGASVGDWLPFADTHEALSKLQTHFQLIIVSNIDNASIAKSARNMGITFDHIFTAQDMGAYKPDLKVFHHFIDKLSHQGIEKSEILHVAQSLYHDHSPAQKIGLDSVWIDRRRGKVGSGATPLTSDVEIPVLSFGSLMEFAEYCDANM